jgi:hypothetical protein
MSIRVAKVADVPRKRLNEGVRLPPGGDRAAAVAYLAAMGADLATIARRHNLPELAYLFDMARLEAESTVQKLST